MHKEKKAVVDAAGTVRAASGRERREDKVEELHRPSCWPAEPPILHCSSNDRRKTITIGRDSLDPKQSLTTGKYEEAIIDACNRNVNI